MQVEEGVDAMLISKCMGYDPGGLHVKMTSPILYDTIRQTVQVSQN
jgi:hypothetical protein